MRRDFSVTGYIPAPLDDDAPVAFMPAGNPIELADFLLRFTMELLSDASFSMCKIHEAVAKTCNAIGCSKIIDTHILQIFDEILVRTLERRQIVENLIATGGTLEIFGPSTWEKRPQFAPPYRGHIVDPRQLDDIYQTSRVNLHNSGLTMHFRIMDCAWPPAALCSSMRRRGTSWPAVSYNTSSRRGTTAPIKSRRLGGRPALSRRSDRAAKNQRRRPPYRACGTHVAPPRFANHEGYWPARVYRSFLRREHRRRASSAASGGCRRK